MESAFPIAAVTHGLEGQAAGSNGEHYQSGWFGNRLHGIRARRVAVRAVCRRVSSAATPLRLYDHRACADDQDAGKNEGVWMEHGHLARVHRAECEQ